MNICFLFNTKVYHLCNPQLKHFVCKEDVHSFMLFLLYGSLGLPSVLRSTSHLVFGHEALFPLAGSCTNGSTWTIAEGFYLSRISSSRVISIHFSLFLFQCLPLFRRSRWCLISSSLWLAVLIKVISILLPILISLTHILCGIQIMTKMFSSQRHMLMPKVGEGEQLAFMWQQ